MQNTLHPKYRSDEKLALRLHGIEMDESNNFVAVIEHRDGTGSLMGFNALNQLAQYAVESDRDPTLSPARRKLLMEEARIVYEAQLLANDARNMYFRPARTARGVREGFTAASTSFPPALVAQAAEVMQKFRLKPPTPSAGG